MSNFLPENDENELSVAVDTKAGTVTYHGKYAPRVNAKVTVENKRRTSKGLKPMTIQETFDFVESNV